MCMLSEFTMHVHYPVSISDAMGTLPIYVQVIEAFAIAFLITTGWATYPSCVSSIFFQIIDSKGVNLGSNSFGNQFLKRS